jgi:hypothetical protein
MIDIDKSTALATQAVTAAEALSTTMLSVEVDSAAKLEWAVAVGHQVREYKRSLEKERDDIAKPLRALATQHTKRWKPAIDMLQSIETHLKRQIVTFQTAERARQTAALAQAATPAEVVQAVEALAPTPRGVQERESWSYEIVDVALVPREYFVLDTARLEREAREQKAAFAVPGTKPVRKVTAVFR